MRLQAIIRGRAVRRQAITTLKCLQSIINIQSQVCAKRFQTSDHTYHCDENSHFQNLKNQILKVGLPKLGPSVSLNIFLIRAFRNIN